MRYAYFPGCKLADILPEYDRATRAVMDALGVRLVDIEMNCCGYPVRHRSIEASLLSAARVLAVAHRHHLSVMTPCKCCYGQLKHAAHWLNRRPELAEAINRHLAGEGLAWQPSTGIVHLLTLLDRDVGVAEIKNRVCRPLENFSIAAHYGCHALRPAGVVQFDDPLAPTLFERLIAAIGGRCVEWPLRLECCGNPLHGKHSELSLCLMIQKLKDADRAGADILCTACTYCQIQFDHIRNEQPPAERAAPDLKAILYIQLLGWSMGLHAAVLGIDLEGARHR